MSVDKWGFKGQEDNSIHPLASSSAHEGVIKISHLWGEGGWFRRGSFLSE